MATFMRYMELIGSRVSFAYSAVENMGPKKLCTNGSLSKRPGGALGAGGAAGIIKSESVEQLEKRGLGLRRRVGLPFL
uniref:Uncharacterized protein n=1 Tax=Romanomermis culicivorax TaxID=13658 RepID=A0A915KWX2_ROMCU